VTLPAIDYACLCLPVRLTIFPSLLLHPFLLHLDPLSLLVGLVYTYVC
jgi:hypothetical protein